MSEFSPRMDGINVSGELKRPGDAQKCSGSSLNQGPDDPGLPEIASVHSPRAEVCAFSKMPA